METRETRLCTLATAVGRTEACPERACPFWEPGGAALGGRCAVDGFGIVPDAALATWLLDLREQLHAASSVDEERAIRDAFHQLLNESGE